MNEPATTRPVDQDELTCWINTEGVRRLRAMEDDPSSVLTEEQAFDSAPGAPQ